MNKSERNHLARDRTLKWERLSALCIYRALAVALVQLQLLRWKTNMTRTYHIKSSLQKQTANNDDFQSLSRSAPSFFFYTSKTVSVHGAHHKYDAEHIQRSSASKARGRKGRRTFRVLARRLKTVTVKMHRGLNSIRKETDQKMLDWTETLPLPIAVGQRARCCLPAESWT